MFVHLNCHSHYSLLAGAEGVEGLVRAACGMGFEALALTDTNGLYGALRFYRLAREAGVRPIFGAELDAPGSTRRAVLLAKDLQGFGEVCRAITDRHLRKNFSLIKSLTRLSGRVIVLCPDPETVQRVAGERGGRDLYVELHRFGNLQGPFLTPESSNQPLPDCARSRLFAGRTCSESALREGVIEFARRHRLPCAATNRVFFARPDGWETHRLLSAIRENATVHTLPKGSVVSPDAWLKPPKEMARLFADAPEAVRNTVRIAEQCDVTLPIGRINFPPFKLPPGRTHSSFLRKLAYEGVKKRYRPMTAEVRERLRHELRVIDDLRFAPYFLIVWDIVREAVRRGIPTVGRGSAANSLVCAALGITEVDPIRYNLYFERFLNPERTDYPDIDIDFPWDRRDEMLDYVFDKYGHENVALISAHVHLRGRSTVREVGKAIGVPIPELDAFTKKLPHSAELSKLEAVRQTVPECRDLPLEDEPYRSILALSRRIEGFPRHLSIHCGGIVVSPFPITDLIPLQKTPKGFVVTQYDMYPVEDMGLLKIDLLAQKGLAVLAETVRTVRENAGVEIDFNRIDPVRDPKTKALVRDGKTVGCFYIESPGMRNLLQKLGVETFEMLTAASSIIRPGVSDSGMMKTFIDRHNGRERVRHLHPKLEEILKETYGVMIYQEDVIKVAHAIAGMSLGEAEGLRKCMSKKRDWESIENYRNRFLAGARGNSVSPDMANEIWRRIESFAGYAFCKAHSASFAVVSYQTAYLKAHYPAEFMAAVLSNRGGFYDACAYVEEARRLGVEILPPDINRSAHKFTAAHTGEPRAIRVGFMQVKRLSRNAIDSILENRKAGPYLSLADFLSRAEIDLSETEALIRCGAFDGLGASRPELLWRLELLGKGSGLSRGPKSARYLPGLRPCAEPDEAPLARIPRLPQYDLREKLRAELECLDLTVSDHLLLLYDIDRRDWLPAREIPRYAGRLVTLVGWLVTYKRTWTVKNELMKFMTLEDPTASFEVTLFPKIYKRFGPLLYDRGPYILKGRVEREGRCHSVTALWLGRLAPYGTRV